MSNQVINLTTKPLNQFTADDTLYIQKTESGFSITYFCKFLELERGIVVAEVVSYEPNYGRSELVGKRITARPTSCYLWGKSDNKARIDWPHCHWFKNTREPAG